MQIPYFPNLSNLTRFLLIIPCTTCFCNVFSRVKKILSHPRHNFGKHVVGGPYKVPPSPEMTLFKGYLHYKTIISQNVSSEAQINNFFILCKSYVLFSSFCIFNHHMIYQICGTMISISA